MKAFIRDKGVWILIAIVSVILGDYIAESVFAGGFLLEIVCFIAVYTLLGLLFIFIEFAIRVFQQK